jgi:hypothetical protein
LAVISIEQMEREWTILLAGVFSQQLSNAPRQTFDEGRFTAAIPELMAMFAYYYSARTPTPETDSHREGR